LNSYLSEKISAKKVAEPPAKKVAELLVKQGLLRKGFLNPRPTVIVTPISPQEVNDVGVVGPSSPPRDCFIPSSVEGNGFSQSRDWPVSFDHNREIVVWEDTDFWDGLTLDWVVDGDFGEEAFAIRDAMKEEFQRDKMIACQKSKDKKELLN
jgi:hypothetical protein